MAFSKSHTKTIQRLTVDGFVATFSKVVCRNSLLKKAHPKRLTVDCFGKVFAKSRAIHLDKHAHDAAKFHANDSILVIQTTI